MSTHVMFGSEVRQIYLTTECVLQVGWPRLLHRFFVCAIGRNTSMSASMSRVRGPVCKTKNSSNKIFKKGMNHECCS